MSVTQYHLVLIGRAVCRRKVPKKFVPTVEQFVVLSPGERCRLCWNWLQARK